MNAQETMHAFYLNFTFINDQECRQHLANEFFYGRNDENIIFQTQEKDDERGGEKILKTSRILEGNSYETGQYESRKYTQTPQGWNRTPMNLTLIGDIKEFLALCHRYNYRNGKESDSKRNGYRK